MPQDFPAWRKCWRLCHPREFVIGKEGNGKETAAAELRIAVHLREDGDRLQDPKAPVFPAEIKASDVVPPLKVMIITCRGWISTNLFITRVDFYDLRSKTCNSPEAFRLENSKVERYEWTINQLEISLLTFILEFQKIFRFAGSISKNAFLVLNTLNLMIYNHVRTEIVKWPYRVFLNNQDKNIAGWNSLSKYVKVYFARLDCVVRWPDITSMVSDKLAETSSVTYDLTWRKSKVYRYCIGNMPL